MHQTLKKYFAIASIATMGLSVVANAATPAEKLTATLTRTAASGVQLSDSLVKNIFKQESKQVPYTEKEAYQETETYYENVPYQATETYTENVPYQDTETYTENVPYQEQEAYTDYEQYTDYENRCETVNDTERVCHNIEDCHIAPGEGPGGGPNRVCTTQPVCENVNRPRTVCNNVPVTKTRPVTRYRTITRYRQETRTRAVTRYRQETRTRTVTKYRQEERTRTVTKYRDKQVCCKTVTNNVFDHQFKLPVVINFPADTVLAGNEQESFVVQFAGSEAAPSVTLSPKSVIFGYAIDHQEFHGGAVVVDLKRVALYNQDQLGVSSIKNLGLSLKANGAEIRFTDEGLRPRVTTAYTYQIHEVGAPDVLAQGQLASPGAQVVIPVQVTLVENKTYQVDVRVGRQGLPLAADIDVVVSAKQTLSSVKDAKIYTDKTKVNTFEVRGEKDQARLFFRDQTPSDEGVVTTYKIEILAGDKNGKVLSTKEIAREKMNVTSKAFFLEMLAADLGVLAQDLKTYVIAGKTVTTRVTVTRQHVSINDGNPVVFVLTHTAKISK